MPTIRLTRRIGNSPNGTLLHVNTNTANWFINKGMATHHTTQPATPTPTTGQPPAGNPPPKAGPGSGRQAWTTYATRLGHTIPPGMTRQQIIETIDAKQRT
jgi:hypothetical protein